MSSFIVSRAHIDVLVLAGVQFGLIPDPTPTALAQVGRMLWSENRHSVDHRYGQHTGPEPYPAPRAEVLLDRIAVIKAIDCYTYQSCAHPAWPDTPAAQYCDRLQNAVRAELPTTWRGRESMDLPGYADTPWAITTITDATAATDTATDPR